MARGLGITHLAPPMPMDLSLRSDDPEPEAGAKEASPAAATNTTVTADEGVDPRASEPKEEVKAASGSGRRRQAVARSVVGATILTAMALAWAA